MVTELTPEEKTKGKENFHRTVGGLASSNVTRRNFMKGMIAAGAGVLPLGAAAFFGYSRIDRPVKAGLIGAGDEGGVLVGEHNPAYLEFVAYSDIRPYNRNRIFRGEDRGPRKGFNHHYGNDAKTKIRLYEDWNKLLDDPEIEAVVIALPLHLHAPVAIEALAKGKHVLTEKLMAWNINQCKKMIKAQADNSTEQKPLLLGVGHQRHYNMLYTHAVEVLRQGVLGDIHHINAYWHRNNARPNPRHRTGDPFDRGPYLDSWSKDIPVEDRELTDAQLRAAGFTSLKELVRWRLYNRTGGGLMAELGSHQLDACSIFLGDVRKKPIAVTAIGGKHFYEDDRDVEDHVYCTYEFPGPGYYAEGDSGRVADANDRTVVTYSSINTNGFNGYGETVMGTKGTMIVHQEEEAMLWGIGGRSMELSVSTSGGAPVLDASGSLPSSAGSAQRLGADSLGAGTPSRGYREEMEHFAYIIRMLNQGTAADRQRPEMQLRCDGQRAMADAIMALTANISMSKHGERIEFQDSWYDPAQLDSVPDAARTAEPFPNAEG